MGHEGYFCYRIESRLEEGDEKWGTQPVTISIQLLKKPLGAGEMAPLVKY